MFFKKNGTQLIDQGLATFEKAESDVLKGIALNTKAIKENEAVVVAAQEAVIKLETAITKTNDDLTARNNKGQRFVDRMRAFFGEDEEAAAVAIKEIVNVAEKTKE